ncbi:MAG: STAS domain-containing protein [Limisphaerales bacterium]
MQITARDKKGIHELVLDGRLDANWADHVGRSIESAIRAGHHQIDLDFSGVSYLSSAGLRVLLGAYKELAAARGQLCVIRPVPSVVEVLELSGLASMLVVERELEGGAETSCQATKEWEQEGSHFQEHELDLSASLSLCLHGDPVMLASGKLVEDSVHGLDCTEDLLALGLGAFSSVPGDREARFGESLAVTGHAVTMPTDGSSVPDYQVAEGKLVPRLNLLYGLSARGAFGRLIRFEASESKRGVLGLSQLVDVVQARAGGGGCGFVILAESAGVVGATLHRSPTLAAGRFILEFPEVRDWLAFTTERSSDRNLLLIAGVAATQPSSDLEPYLRKVGAGTEALGHFHAAVFPYRPIPKGRIVLGDAVSNLLSSESAGSVLHLMADNRQFDGVGETDLMRGACWVAPFQLSEPSKND